MAKPDGENLMLLQSKRFKRKLQKHLIYKSDTGVDICVSPPSE